MSLIMPNLILPKIPIITIIGYSDSGKTRCATGLTSILTQRGYRVASAKHCHDDFDLDVEGKDSWKHRQSGASTSIMSAQNRIGVMAATNSRISLAELCDRYIYDADILLAEGYSFEPFPKILVSSQKTLDEERINDPKSIIAIVRAKPFDCDSIDRFTFSEMDALATFLEKNYLLPGKADVGKSSYFPRLFS